MKRIYLDRVSREMAEDFPAADLPPREALAAACCILAREGHESGLAGQVTARAEKAGAWWTLPFGCGFDEASVERMVLVDDDLKPLEGGRPSPGVRFHLWIYGKRPDVNAMSIPTRRMPRHSRRRARRCVSSTWIAPCCMALPICRSGQAFPSPTTRGESSPERSATPKPSCSPTTGATYLAVFFERAARMQLRAMASGGFKEVKPELAAEARAFLLQPSIIRATFAYWARRCA